jgi:hypothetical protein
VRTTYIDKQTERAHSMSKQMKATDIIRETVAYYRTNLRGVDVTDAGTQCRYNWADGSHCAVGRCLEKKYQDMGEDMPGNEQDVESLLDHLEVNNIDDVLQEKYRGHSKEFWEQLQDFHDYSANWTNENRLTCIGEDGFYILIDRHKVQEK